MEKETSIQELMKADMARKHARTMSVVKEKALADAPDQSDVEQKRWQAGLENIIGQLEFFVGAEGRNKISQEWQSAIEKMAQLDYQLPPINYNLYFACKALKGEEATEDEILEAINALHPLYNQIGLSNETYETFYKCGSRLYENNQFVEASDVFHFLLILDVRRTNVWIAQGLAYKAAEKWDQAIVAFLNGLLFGGETVILPLIHLGDCYIKNGDTTRARDCLESAIETLKNNPDLPDGDVMIDYARSLLRKI